MPATVVWLSDIHLDFVDAAAARILAASVADQEPGAVVLTGDIAHSIDLVPSLELLPATIPCPIYFVLGDHDFYHGFIRTTRSRLVRSLRARDLTYLTDRGRPRQRTCRRTVPVCGPTSHSVHESLQPVAR